MNEKLDVLSIYAGSFPLIFLYSLSYHSVPHLRDPVYSYFISPSAMAASAEALFDVLGKRYEDAFADSPKLHKFLELA